MRFIDDAGNDFGLIEASALGCPPERGDLFFPSGEDDLRPTIYAPYSSYTDFAASALVALFPGEIDPMLSIRLAQAAFSGSPLASTLSADVPIIDFADATRGPADPGALMLAGILAPLVKKRGPRILLADGSEAEGPTLAEAAAGVEGLDVVLLYPENSHAVGIRSDLLARKGGFVRIAAVRGGSGEVARLLRSIAGAEIEGKAVTVAGPANPARFAARILVFAAVFAAFRTEAAGEFYFALRASDGLVLAACIWAWRLGVPLTGIVMPALIGKDVSTPMARFDLESRRFIARLEEERPGLLKSLVVFHDIRSGNVAGGARGENDTDSAAAVDMDTAAAYAAAEQHLRSGLRGHAKIFILDGHGARRRRISKNLGPAGARDSDALDPDYTIGPDVSELRAVLAR
jgi:hypothetical protein